MVKPERNPQSELHDKIKAGFVYLSFALPIVFYFLISPEAAPIGWVAHFVVLLFIPRIKGEGTRWTFKRQLKWIGGSMVYFVVLAMFFDNSDDVFCDIAPEVTAEVILRSNAEYPKLLSEEISAQELMNMIGDESRLAEFEASINSQPDCIDKMSIFEAVKIAGTKPDFRDLLEDHYDETFSSVRRFFEENETGKHAVYLTLTYDSKNNVFVDRSAENASFNSPASAVINAIKSGAGDFLDLEILDNAKISFVSELSVDGDDIKLEPVEQSRLRVNINGQSLEDWKKTNEEFLTAKAQETERLAEVARVAEERRKEEERLAEIERKRAEAEFERSIPKMSALDLDYAYRNNEMRADAAYTDKIVQISGYVDADGVSDGWLGLSVQLQAGYMSVTCHFDRTDENKARAMKLNYGSYVVIRGECQGTSLGEVQLYDCEFRN